MRVVHIPSKRDKERVDELDSSLSLVIIDGLLVGDVVGEAAYKLNDAIRRGHSRELQLR